MNLKANRGIVVISRDILEDYISHFDEENPLFRDFIPAKIDYDYMTDTMKIHGYSKHFRVVYEGETTPIYDVTVSSNTKVVSLTTTKFREIQNFS